MRRTIQQPLKPLFFSALLIAAGCVPSLHPIYTADDVVFDEALLGTWADPDSDETWAFSRSETKDNAYRLVYTEEDGSGAFLTHLVKIGDELFLDLFPEEPTLEANDFYKAHLMLAHTFLHVRQIKPKLQLAYLDPEWVEEHLSQHPTALKHEIVALPKDQRIVFTASTDDLQAFHVKHLKTDGAYDDASEPMHRVDAEAEDS